MPKTLVGPRLRQLRRERKQTQAEMAKQLGVSASYVNLLENNQRSLSVQMLMTIADTYAINWRDLAKDESTRRVADLRNAVQDPMFSGDMPDIQELRGAIDHAPRLVEHFLQLHDSHRAALEKIMKLGGADSASELLRSSPESMIHDFFRDHSNYFPELETAAEAAWGGRFSTPENRYSELRDRLEQEHGISVVVRRIDDMGDALRFYSEPDRQVHLSQALNNSNRVFQLAHVLCVVEHASTLADVVAQSGIESPQALARLRVELANYFAAAFLMPYDAFYAEAESTGYDLDRIAAAFGTSFEQVCQRVTTLQREGARGVPFFFIRIDKAGNVTKRFNSTSFHLAEHGGSCPVWNIHTAFYTPGVIMPQFVEMPDGDRYFTISRTVHRPVFSEETQDRRLTLALGCEAGYAHRIRYASSYNFDDPKLYAPIGINCHLCPRQACSQRAHQPLFIELPMDENRRGSTRYES
ncbi:helix-turn-helix domain-containing protein [Tropicimonas marinistellae]|uniref:helix-turn-helix domain-containing protein n=1 Tax=Tropicimonas marinistellae TaxID=1739787 RepID=UPI0008347CF6|nr:XRE family transcriptional regulator [Tropicimonas marinistellae]